MLTFLATYSFFFLLIIGMVYPSDGNHSVFAPKSMAFLNAAFWFIIFVICRFKCSLSQAKALLFSFFALLFFGLWYAIGIDQNPQIPSGQFDQFKVFMTTIFVPVAGWYYYKEGLFSLNRVFNTLIYANFTYCTIKVILMTLHLLGLINVWGFMHNTGLRFMSMNIFGEVGRIQTSVDIATPYLIFFVLQGETFGLKFSKKTVWFFLIIGALSSFLSFSRLLIFGYFISIFFHGLTLKLTSQAKFFAAAFVLMVASIYVVGPAKVEKVIERRLFSNDNHYSDATRHEQVDALMEACDEAPFLGKGLGGYTTKCIRDWQLPHAYEVQWVAFLMQFGALGIIFLSLPVFWIAWKLIEPPFTRPRLALFLLYGLWIISGFTNPFMISLTSGIIYLLFIFGALSTSATSAPISVRD